MHGPGGDAASSGLFHLALANQAAQESVATD
jgi:hypothetical protein